MADQLARMTITVDVLNDEPFIDAMQRAIDLSAAVERTLDAIKSGQAAPLEALEAQNTHFRDFFRGSDDDEI